jgi:folate-binding protein YgfZ
MKADDNGRMFDTTTLQGAASLDHWGVIRAEGADAATFLQGQLTQDIASLDTGRAALAGYCSPKGRLLASFVVWRRAAPDEFLLACSADLLAPTVKRLSMYVLRAKCKLSDASDRFQLVGLAGDAARDAGAAPWARSERGAATLIRLPDAARVARAWWVAPRDAERPALPALDAAAWRWLEVCSGVPTIVAATADRFVPQMVNLELLHGVDFHKGCYPGQEVVARSQYRGTIKRRSLLFDAPALARAGDEVFHDAEPGQPAGMIVDAAAAPGGGSTALVEVKLEALAGGALHLGTADGPTLERRTMPYDVPLDGDA